MQTYWERRRNNQEENHSPEKKVATLESKYKPPRGESDGSGTRISSDSLEKRPTKKNSQKENKKHPYKNKKK